MLQARQQAAQLDLQRAQLNRPPEQARMLQYLTGQGIPQSEALSMLYPKTEEWKPVTVKDLYGRPMQILYNVRTGEKMGGDAASTAPVMPPATGSVPFVGAQGQAAPIMPSPTSPMPTAAPPVRPPGGAAPPPGASAAEHEAFLRANPQIDPTEYTKEITKMNVSKAAAEEQTQKSAQNVINTIDRATNLVTGSKLPTTGLVGTYLSKIPGTEATNLEKLVTTIKANAAFDRLQAMRNASPTGGALGQVSNQEENMLSASIANLEQSQTREQFLYNLQVVKQNYHDIVHGPGSYEKTYGKIGAQQAVAAPPSARRLGPSREDYATELRRRGVKLPGE